MKLASVNEGPKLSGRDNLSVWSLFYFSVSPADIYHGVLGGGCGGGAGSHLQRDRALVALQTDGTPYYALPPI